MLMLVFVYLFGGALQTGTKYVTYVVPGVLLLCSGFGASLTAAPSAMTWLGASSTAFDQWTSGARHSC